MTNRNYEWMYTLINFPIPSFSGSGDFPEDWMKKFLSLELLTFLPDSHHFCHLNGYNSAMGF